MKLSELFHGKSAVFSPNGKYLACFHDSNVDVRFSDSLLKAFSSQCFRTVEAVVWSSDSLLLLCIAGESYMQIFTLCSKSSVALIRGQVIDPTNVFWTPNSRVIINLEPQLCRVAIWTLDNASPGVRHINNVQPWARPTVSLSPNGNWLAVVSFQETSVQEACHKNLKDRVLFYSTHRWIKQKFVVVPDSVRRVGGVSWNFDNDTLAVWPMDSLGPVLIISASSGIIMNQWTPSDVSIWTGVANAKFSPSSQFLSIMSKNGQVHILNYLNWKLDSELHHFPIVLNLKTRVYQETVKEDLHNKNITTQLKQIVERPISISLLKSLPKRSCTAFMAWSSGGHFLATCIPQTPAVVWIWNAKTYFSMDSVIVLESPVKSFSWSSVHNELAICCGKDGVVIWSPNSDGVHCVSLGVPLINFPFAVVHVAWSPDGRTLVASSEINSSVIDIKLPKSLSC